MIPNRCRRGSGGTASAGGENATPLPALPDAFNLPPPKVVLMESPQFLKTPPAHEYSDQGVVSNQTVTHSGLGR